MQLNDTVKRKFRNVIVDLPPKDAMKFFKSCLQLGLINESYSFIFTTFVSSLFKLQLICLLFYIKQDIETLDLEDYKYNRANITAFRIVNTNSEFFKKVSSNLTDYYKFHENGIDTSKLLIKVCFFCN